MKALFVCSTGGHLTELMHWAERMNPEPTERFWVTHYRANSQTITDRDPEAKLFFVPPIESKQASVAAAMIPYARHLISHLGVDVVISTGAAVAVPFAVAARRLGVPFHYIESAARIERPSVSGRLIRALNLGQCWSTGQHWVGWRAAGSIFDSFTSRRAFPAGPIKRVVVALGTQAGFGFRAGLEGVVRAYASAGQSPETLWQVGSTAVGGLSIADPRTHLPEAELVAGMQSADVVVTHAGVGLAHLAMRAGKTPILLPRRVSRGEHTDDHQLELARWLQSRGLAVAVEAPDLVWADLERARQQQVSERCSAELSRVSVGSHADPHVAAGWS